MTGKARQVIIFVAILLVGGLIWYSSGMTKEETKDKGEVTIGLNNWAENIAVSNMWKVLLEEKGYEVKLMSLEKAPVWTGVATGDLDFSPEIWLPHTDKPFYEKYKDDVVLGDTWYEGTNLGLVVPEYVDVDSIEDLNANKEQFERGGKPSIVGIDAGTSTMKMTEDVIEKYGLDFDLIVSSGPAMTSELDKAIKDKKPIVVTLWNPHWAFAEYDLKYLKDPKNIYGDKENIQYMHRKGFEKDFPEMKKWLNNWEMDDQSLGTLMDEIRKADDPEKGAKKWVKDNRDLVDQWLK
ncbi:glycine betaine ABC transporter substrate-binding protein [Melghirimyces algeriensis]|uniref:Glycine betaine/proline transport system substrate-binding protein n=1 Tax=Melghirimyces algeriensis TaxID=910412 RepID=A0A521DDJ3_9BACL|nr:glycine betaine ABC transporter substrate-binding protein [Melghirimyces algeriensis]SMO69668.1 glycine betaine/proline transport system substrate-binding protein [Melghirimyces algeriensis]